MHIDLVANIRARVKRTYHDVVAVVTDPPFAPLGHYYSPLTDKADGRRAASWASTQESPAGVNVDLAEMAALARELAPMWAELPQSARYRQASMFALADAAVYHSMLRHFSPASIVEVGSGYSTAVALDAIDAYHLPAQLQCIEPHPERLLSLLRPADNVSLTRSIVQDVPLSTFDVLGSGDFLFIDSTHVAKSGSDVVWTTLHVLPRLSADVIVHIHDMFWPLEYKDDWLLRRRDWNEIYLIHAFLSGNSHWRILVFNDQIWRNQSDLVQRYLPAAVDQRPGGLWLQKID